MSRVIILDSDPLGMVTNPKASSAEIQECKVWLNSLMRRGEIIILPEIADYEVRRELIRAGKLAGIQRLDELKLQLTYRPLTTEVMLLAAQLWADSRRRGRPTAEPNALDRRTRRKPLALDTGISRQRFQPPPAFNKS
ncbi:nucleic acid-binding protein [Microcoleus sp. D2_18a_B4]|uniref:nucleic acid-binding protein n=1 Tax=Microcoleus sp. D2_18a_B4 TaxID=3055329 RepID=UPI002FCF2102